jgi:hypothetical protein
MDLERRKFGLNVDLNGKRYWAGHVHLVVSGSDKPPLQKVLQIEKHRPIQQ